MIPLIAWQQRSVVKRLLWYDTCRTLCSECQRFMLYIFPFCGMETYVFSLYAGSQKDAQRKGTCHTYPTGVVFFCMISMQVSSSGERVLDGLKAENRWLSASSLRLIRVFCVFSATCSQIWTWCFCIVHMRLSG
jgi:hypothetical protein